MSDFYNYITLLAIISLFQTEQNKTEKKKKNKGVDPVSFCRDIASKCSKYFRLYILVKQNPL